MADREDALRHHVLNLLTARQAHATFDDAIGGLAPELRGVRPEGLPYSVWEQVEHMRIAQRDILEFCRAPEYAEREWPNDYWPDASAPDDDTVWTSSVEGFRTDLESICDMVRDDSIDLYEPVPHGDEQTYLREALLVADHNAYHIGQIITIRRQLDAWGDHADG
ncbi:ABC transporter [Longibacter salinarum]|uniref:ABC transporter n=1 Tax=Longibacter salinarum TaxID=1850348 RepID=A0A2A8CWP5_9BACT|nr:DinB family protein [Longibacter salinarum]PEN13017.1 ABC transporter [Longibacter salinarum]